jgi:hypothetical protein
VRVKRTVIVAALAALALLGPSLVLAGPIQSQVGINGLDMTVNPAPWRSLGSERLVTGLQDLATNFGTAPSALYSLSILGAYGAGGNVKTLTYANSTGGDGIAGGTGYGDLRTYAQQQIFNGTTWDRRRSVGAGDGIATGLAASGNYEFNGTNWDRTRSSFTQSTTGINANGAGSTVTMTTTPMSDFTMIVDRTAGSTDAVEIDVECSINGTAWVQIATVTSLTGEPVLANAVDVPCSLLRYNVVTIGTGNTVAIDLLATR